jgi:hypothetical protein
MTASVSDVAGPPLGVHRPPNVTVALSVWFGRLSQLVDEAPLFKGIPPVAAPPVELRQLGTAVRAPSMLRRVEGRDAPISGICCSRR